ncbi:MAG: hypothetical protein OEV97_00690 [Betaproteobacteria bacterium]|nr:hypothetical protein [Betaproteobacteria bacterium]
MDAALALLQDLLANPAVQSSVLPLAAGLACAALLYPVRLEGLAAIAGFLAAVAAIGNFGLEPLTATRKIVVTGAAAAAIGVLSDFAFKPTRFSAPVLGAIFGAAALWVFASVLRQKAPLELALVGAGVVALTVWLVSATVSLQLDSARAGASGLMLGLGTGVSAVLGASALIGQYGMALGAACGGFLLLLLALGPRVGAGHALTLTVSVLSALLAAASVLLAQVPAVALAALALVPVAARLPLPGTPLWMQPVLAGVYTGVPAAGACVLAWLSGRGWTW